jgi:hypothetical protein
METAGLSRNPYPYCFFARFQRFPNRNHFGFGGVHRFFPFFEFAGPRGRLPILRTPLGLVQVWANIFFHS